MASISSKYPHIHPYHTNPNTITSIHLSSSSSSPSILSFPSYWTPSNKPRFCSIKISSDNNNSTHDINGADLLRKPVVSPSTVEDEDDKASDEEGFVDWEDQILEDTVPLVGFVRMILHSDKYESGERLSPQHEKTIVERLLPYHPEYEKKIGSGIDYITVGYHPDFETSRCMFIVRKDGDVVDFSYWKCIKGLIRKNYPLYADSFILRHFRRRKHND